MNQHQNFDQILGSAVVANWIDLMRGARSGLIHVEYGFALERKIHAAGWNFFFMAAEVKVTFFGCRWSEEDPERINADSRGKVQQQHFNSLEVTEIVDKRFLGVPYGTVSAHSRHIQQGWRLDGAEARRLSRRDTELA